MLQAVLPALSQKGHISEATTTSVLLSKSQVKLHFLLRKIVNVRKGSAWGKLSVAFLFYRIYFNASSYNSIFLNGW